MNWGEEWGKEKKRGGEGEEEERIQINSNLEIWAGQTMEGPIELIAYNFITSSACFCLSFSHTQGHICPHALTQACIPNRNKGECMLLILMNDPLQPALAMETKSWPLLQSYFLHHSSLKCHDKGSCETERYPGPEGERRWPEPKQAVACPSLTETPNI